MDYGSPAPHSGQQDLDLNGNTTGAIYQRIPTDATHTYAISFYLAGNPCATPIKTLSVSFGTTTNSYAFDTTGKSGATTAGLGWVNETFTAAGAQGAGTTPLTFTSTTTAYCGPELDDVVVTDLGLTSTLNNGNGTATPELGSGQLLATGLLPLGAVLLYRRRRTRRTTQR